MSQNANSHYTCKKDEGQLTRDLYFILRLLPSARCLRHTLGVRINDIMLRVSIQVLLPSSFISVSKKVSYFTSKDGPPAHRQTEEKRYDIFGT